MTPSSPNVPFLTSASTIDRVGVLQHWCDVDLAFVECYDIVRVASEVFEAVFYYSYSRKFVLSLSIASSLFVACWLAQNLLHVFHFLLNGISSSLNNKNRLVPSLFDRCLWSETSSLFVPLVTKTYYFPTLSIS